MSSRELILERLKSAPWAESTPSRNIISPESSAAKGQVQTFIEKATAAGAQVEVVNNLAEVQTRIGQIAAEAKIEKIIVADEEITRQIDWQELQEQSGCQIQISYQLKGDAYRSYVLAADLGITGCKYALAETGSVVLEHSHANERLVSHAPNHYMCIVRKEQILRDRLVLAAVLENDQPKPSAWTLVTGVSRTADVALQVVLGMHGPRQVTIFLID